MQISEDRYKRSRRIRWRNPHSRRLQQALHDDRLLVGWDSQAENPDGSGGCWVLARLCLRTVVSHYFQKERCHQEMVPVVWKHLVDDDTGTPIHVADARVIPFLQKCDTYNRANAIAEALDIHELDELTAAERIKSTFRDRAKEAWEPFKKYADSLGTWNMPRKGRIGAIRSVDRGRRKPKAA